MKCPHCGKAIKGHAEGTANFRRLSRAQQKAPIAGMTAKLNAMRKIYGAEKPMQSRWLPAHRYRGVHALASIDLPAAR